jgi:hypothetical protein
MSLFYKIRDKRRSLISALTELAGSAHISFEGDLSGTFITRVPGASSEETQVLKRSTLWPKQDLVVLPLEADLVKPIMAAVGGTVPRGILHIQIEKMVGSNSGFTTILRQKRHSSDRR